MPPTLKNHLTVWRTIADGLKRGDTLLATLEHVKARLGRTEFEAAASQLMRDVREGKPLSEAMARHAGAFSRCVCAMVRAGEAGSVLDVIASRIVEGIQDGSFPLPGAGAAALDDQAAYWRAFGRLLSSGVPILEALELIAAEVAGPKLREATGAIRRAILDGKDMATALQGMPELFSEEVRLAVGSGERAGDLDARAFRIADAIEAGDLSGLVPDRSMLHAREEAERDESPIVKLLDAILTQAFTGKASDIHFDPAPNGLKLRYRVDGVLHEMTPPPPHLTAALISRIKILAAMDIAEKRVPQDGRIQLTLGGKDLDLRVCAVPTVLGERIVIRLLDAQAVCLDLERIGILDDQLATVRELCHLPNGIVVCNGPTGSGKTTLLYAMLMEVDRGKCCVMSVEDPVEYRLDGVAQIQVDPRRGLTFARALRSVLRQDPDVIMVGELRDLETAHVTVQCSLTGHLILTTLHANTSPGAVKRLLDMGLAPFLVNATVAGVVSQRLVRVLCPKCKQEARPALHSVPQEAVEFIKRLGERAFYGPKGCEACHGMGYRGRTAIHEILVPDDRVRNAVAASADLASIRNAALAAGMKPMLVCGLEKAARGITSIEEVCRVAPHGPND